MIDPQYKKDLPEGFEDKLKRDYVFIDSDFSELEVSDQYYEFK